MTVLLIATLALLLFAALCGLVSRCSHKRTTFPLTVLGAPMYIVCLDCGRRFDYDWSAMRIGRPRGAGIEAQLLQREPRPRSPPVDEIAKMELIQALAVRVMGWQAIIATGLDHTKFVKLFVPARIPAGPTIQLTRSRIVPGTHSSPMRTASRLLTG